MFIQCVIISDVRLPVSKVEFQSAANNEQSLSEFSDNISGTHPLTEYQILQEKMDKDIR